MIDVLVICVAQEWLSSFEITEALKGKPEAAPRDNNQTVLDALWQDIAKAAPYFCQAPQT